MTSIERARNAICTWMDNYWLGDVNDDEKDIIVAAGKDYELAYTEEHSRVEECHESLKKQSAYTFELENKVEARDKLLDEARKSIEGLYAELLKHLGCGDKVPWCMSIANSVCESIDTLRKEGR